MHAFALFYATKTFSANAPFLKIYPLRGICLQKKYLCMFKNPVAMCGNSSSENDLNINPCF